MHMETPLADRLLLTHCHIVILNSRNRL